MKRTLTLLLLTLSGCAIFQPHVQKVGLNEAAQQIVSSTGAIVASARRYGATYGATSGGSEVGSFPNAAQLGGGERLLGDQNGNTVNITPAQIGQYLGIPNGLIFPFSITLGGTGATTAAAAMANLLPTFVPGDCLSNTSGALVWSGCGGSPPGSNYQLAYNDDGTWGALAFGTFGYPLLSGGSTAVPAFGQLDLTLGVTNTLPATNGGTGLSSYATGDILYASAANTLSVLAPGANGTVLALSGGVPVWATGVLSVSGTPAAFSTAAFSSSTGVEGVAPGTSGQCYISNGASAYPSFQVCPAGSWTGTPAIPPAIGGTTPAAGAFTTLNSTSTAVFDGTTVPASAGTLIGTGSTSPALPNGSTATTQTTGDNTTKLATDAFVIANAVSAGVSSLAAGSGVAVSGATGAVTISTTYSIRTVTGSSDTVLPTDCANGIYYDYSGAVSVTLPQATGSFAGCSVDIWTAGGTTVTVTPTTSTVNGNMTLLVGASLWAQVVAQSGNYLAYGTATAPSGGAANVQTFTTSGTWMKPGTGNVTRAICIGGGGGGASGAVEPSGTEAGPGAGGGGAIEVDAVFPTASLSSTVTVTIPTAAAGGASVSSTGNGHNGTTGGNSTFGSYLTAYGGGAGNAGSTGVTSNGGGSAGFLSAGNGATAGAGCAIGGSTGIGGNSGCPNGGGAGGGAPLSGGAGTAGGPSLLGGAGGAAGGGITTAPAASAGAIGGASANTTGGTAGAIATGGGAGNAPTNVGGGSGGGGGGSSITGNAGGGGNGAIGAGGGGGGAALNGTGSSGAGGTGGPGECVVVTQ